MRPGSTNGPTRSRAAAPATTRCGIEARTRGSTRSRASGPPATTSRGAGGPEGADGALSAGTPRRPASRSARSVAEVSAGSASTTTVADAYAVRRRAASAPNWALSVRVAGSRSDAATTSPAWSRRSSAARAASSAPEGPSQGTASVQRPPGPSSSASRRRTAGSSGRRTVGPSSPTWRTPGERVSTGTPGRRVRRVVPRVDDMRRAWHGAADGGVARPQAAGPWVEDTREKRPRAVPPQWNRPRQSAEPSIRPCRGCG